MNRWKPFPRQVAAVFAASVLACGGETGTEIPPAVDACAGPERWEQITAPDGVPEMSTRFVWDGRRLLVVGGHVRNDKAGPGSLEPAGLPALQAAGYEPATGHWFLFEGDGAPWPRVDHCAAWADSRLVVWGGGWKGGEPPSQPRGASYDFTTDRWMPMAEGAPVGDWCTLVSAGDRVLGWAGTCEDMECHEIQPVGGFFAPIANQWTAIAKFGAPEVRSGAANVWTGSQLIVWGGMVPPLLDAGEAVATGAVYDAPTDRWTSTAVQGAPLPRRAHAGVWTGSRMLVWGGVANVGLPEPQDPYERTRTGGLYDPATDTWAATSTEGAPAARADPLLLWTGRHAIVVGGMSQVWGGIYDPEVDRWLPMSSEGAPDCYFGFYAGWDGCRAIIMGQRGVVVGKCPNVEAYVPEFWAYYPPPEVRAAASAEQAAKPQP